MAEREQWGSRIGLILAMAGNAIGLGNFLRFPVQAASNGGGAFMIPYFISFVLLAIPLMWVEWAIGRNGGKYGHGSLPGMFDVMWKNKSAKYFGVLGLFISMTIVIYYTYIESWCLGFSFLSLFNDYHGLTTLNEMSSYLHSYQGIEQGKFNGFGTAYIFLILTVIANFVILWRGISGGIEKFAKIALPLLFVFGIGLLIWVFSIGTPDPINHPDWSISKGFAFMWNPDFSQLTNPNIWLAAAGQIFFTVSVGMGTLHAYASYLRPKDDIALSGLATSSLNEFAEVILGGSIAIPVAVAFFGIAGTQIIAQGGSFNLGFVSMPVIFTQIPYGNVIGFIWFFLLFFAGITSSVAMAQPLVAFLHEEFHISSKKATIYIMLFVLIAVNLVVIYLKYGFLDEMDYWGGTFGLSILALIELIMFGWIWGMKKGWKEINEGADIKIPYIFKFIIKYVTPAYLLGIFGFWAFSKNGALAILLMDVDPNGNPVNPENVPYIWFARGLLVFILVMYILLIKIAWKKNKHQYPEEFNMEGKNNV